MIYLLMFLTLNFSCTEKNASNVKTNSSEVNKENIENFVDASNTKLKYTSGIRSILQDSKGNYWFGSHQEGVCLFDEKTFTYFTVKDGLSDNQVRTIQEDKNGVIWFGTGHGVSNYKDGIIENQMSKNIVTGLQSITNGDWSLTENDLWFDAGKESGAYKFDGQKLNYLEFPVQGVTNTFNTYSATGFSKGKKGDLWIATFAAVFGYDGKSFEIIDDKMLDYSNEKEQLHVRSILEDSKGKLWIGNNGIGVLLKKENAVINFSKEKGLANSPSFGTGDLSPAGTLEHVFVIAEDANGNIWFGDRDTGAWKYDGKIMTNYTVDDKLKTQMIWDIYQDNKGDLLFAMGGSGVYQFNGKTFDKKF